MPRTLLMAIRTSGAATAVPAATIPPATAAHGSSSPSSRRLSRATQAPARLCGISSEGRYRGGKTPSLSRNISPIAAMTQF